MVSKNQIKLINSLHQKKYRMMHQLFIAEGVKVVQELLQSNFKLQHLYSLESENFEVSKEQWTIVSATELKKMSALSSPSTCLAVFEMIPTAPFVEKGLVVALDDIRDPGNFGTIIRLCDWFGVSQLICSTETVDLYNPKVIQATMGSVARVNVTYGNLNELLSKTALSVYGTFMDGVNVYQSQLPQDAILVLGNEANGISEQLEKIITRKLSIPRFGTVQKTESLNVATATAIFLSEFRRTN